MQRLLMGLFLLPFLTQAQKVTKDIQPDNHQVWLVTDDVDLNFRIIQSGAIFAHFRTEGPDRETDIPIPPSRDSDRRQPLRRLAGDQYAR